MKNVFNPPDLAELTARIERLKSDTTPQWGKMNVGQMLAHCNVSYEMAFEHKHPRPNPLVRFLLKLFVKNQVVGPKPYPRNGRTAPAFVVADQRDFEHEKQRLLGYLHQTQQLGEAHFAGRESHSFGPLSASEWNTMFYKHLDHHLNQFGV